MFTTVARTLVGAAFLFSAISVPAQDAPIYEYLSPVLASAIAGSASGSSVSRDGEWLAVGMPGYTDGDQTASGLVAIYRWRDGEWKTLQFLRLAVLDGESPQANARFGAAVSVSGARVLIGCPGCTDGRAKAYLVDLQEPVLPATFRKLYPAIISDADSQLGIGSSVAMSGSIVAIGGPLGRSAVAGVERGAVATGRFDGTGVVWEDVLFGPESPAGSRFGQSLAMIATSGSTPLSGTRALLIGAPTYVNAGGFGLAGRAYLYQRPNLGSGWDLQQSFANTTPGLADAMGSSVAIDRDAAGGTGFIVLGAPGRAVDGTPGGGAFVYSSPPGASVYAFEALIQHPDAVASDRFGSAVGVDGDRIVVGADGRARIDTVPDEGRGYVFERRVLLGNTDWPWRQDLRFPGLGNVNLGRALAMSRNMVVLGAPSVSSDNGGLAVVYACDLIFADGFLAATSAQSCALP